MTTSWPGRAEHSGQELDMNRLFSVAIACAFVGCGTPARPEPVSFLGIPESQASDRGPVGLIKGQPCRVPTVTAVSEVPYDEYAQAKHEGRVIAEETHGDHVYWAVEVERCVRFDNASAMVFVRERFKSRKP